ncbi:MAG: hypothetical protein HN749_00240 [Nitrospina sp.]|nr:hypothetical protein [Nitrospina sp.]
MDEELHAVIALHHSFNFFVVLRRVIYKFPEQGFIVLIVFRKIRNFKTLIAVLILKTTIYFSIKMSDAFHNRFFSPKMLTYKKNV